MPHESAHDLPVTYKFKEQKVCEAALTVGAVVAKARMRSASAPELREAPKGAENAYKRTLLSLGEEWLDRWGVAFKAKDFRSFRFPAAADRVIYWASDELHDHLSLELPRGGYEVNHQQLGSDHRPVSLEASEASR